jgi:hypothetical protein
MNWGEGEEESMKVGIGVCVQDFFCFGIFLSGLPLATWGQQKPQAWLCWGQEVPVRKKGLPSGLGKGLAGFPSLLLPYLLFVFVYLFLDYLAFLFLLVGLNEIPKSMCLTWLI